MLASNDHLELREIASELTTIQLDAPTIAPDTMLRIQELTGLDAMALYSLRQHTESWSVEHWVATKELAPVKRRLESLFKRLQNPVFYNPASPPIPQRNRVVEAVSWVTMHAPGTFETSPLYLHVLEPLQLHRHHQPRVLVCEGPDLLAWFGGFHAALPTPRQQQLLAALIQPVQRRMIAERRMLHAPLERAALEVLLDRLASPAFVVDASGFIDGMNASGRALLNTRRNDVADALRAAIHGRPSELVFELTPIHARGMPRSWIANLRLETFEQRIATAIRTCALRWQLTPRQTEVLELVVRGKATATIAATFGCTERAVELHITKLLDRACVDGRAALVAAVFTS